MARNTYLNIAGTFRTVKMVWVKVAGSWKYLVYPYINVNGIWNQCITYGALPGNTAVLQAGGNFPGPDVTWTVCYPRINTVAAPKCAYVSSITQTHGSSSVSFYIKVQGQRSGEQILDATVDVRLDITHPIYGSISNVIASGVNLIKTSGVQVSVSLASFDWGLHGSQWRSDDIGTITLENITWAGTYASCP